MSEINGVENARHSDRMPAMVNPAIAAPYEGVVRTCMDAWKKAKIKTIFFGFNNLYIIIIWYYIKFFT